MLYTFRLTGEAKQSPDLGWGAVGGAGGGWHAVRGDPEEQPIGLFLS